jgi:hypothetical protein
LSPRFTAVYTNDFEGILGSEWALRKTSITPLGGRKFLGMYGQDNESIVLTNIPPHTDVVLSFDLFVILTWNGNNDPNEPDIFSVKLEGIRTLLNATFGSYVTQSFPLNYSECKFPGYTGAAEFGTLGFLWNNNIGDNQPCDAVYNLSFAFPHTSNSLVPSFSGKGVDLRDAESWGIDNVVISLANSFPNSPPEILEQPQNQISRQGDFVFFKVLAIGHSPLKYQWRFNGRNIASGTNNLLILSDVASSVARRYSAIVENDYGFISRAPANLSVIVSEPYGQTVNSGGKASFIVSVSGTAAFQLFFNGK